MIHHFQFCRPTSNITTTTPNNSIQIPETIQEPNASYDSNTELIIDETFEDPELVIDEKVDDDSELIIDEHFDEHIDEHVDEHLGEHDLIIDEHIDEHLSEHELIIDEHIDEPELKIDENMDSMPTQETKATLVENYMETTVHDRKMPQVIIPKNLIHPSTTKQLELVQPILIQCSMKNLETNEKTTIAIPRTEIIKTETPEVDPLKTEMGEFHVKEAEHISLEPTENSEIDEGYHTGM